MVSFGIEDSDGVLTKPMADGDIIEFVDVSSGKVSRYQITDATAAPTAVGVAYISGDSEFVRDEEEAGFISIRRMQVELAKSMLTSKMRYVSR